MFYIVLTVIVLGASYWVANKLRDTDLPRPENFPNGFAYNRAPAADAIPTSDQVA